MIIYLAGGMKSDWQDRVIESLRGRRVSWYDPRYHGLEHENEYTAWDLAAIRKSDIVFACMTINNPSGYGMTHEIGYAAALGKYIIFVDERSPVDPKFRRFMGMNRAVSNYVATDLRDGIANLLMVIDHPEFIEASNAALARIRLGHG